MPVIGPVVVFCHTQTLNSKLAVDLAERMRQWTPDTEVGDIFLHCERSSNYFVLAELPFASWPASRAFSRAVRALAYLVLIRGADGPLLKIFGQVRSLFCLRQCSDALKCRHVACFVLLSTRATTSRPARCCFAKPHGQFDRDSVCQFPFACLALNSRRLVFVLCELNSLCLCCLQAQLGLQAVH